MHGVSQVVFTEASSQCFRRLVLRRQAVLGSGNAHHFLQTVVLEQLNSDRHVRRQVVNIVFRERGLVDFIADELLRFLSLQSRHLDVADLEAVLLDRVNDLAHAEVRVRLDQHEALLQVLTAGLLRMERFTREVVRVRHYFELASVHSNRGAHIQV